MFYSKIGPVPFNGTMGTSGYIIYIYIYTHTYVHITYIYIYITLYYYITISKHTIVYLIHIHVQMHVTRSCTHELRPHNLRLRGHRKEVCSENLLGASVFKGLNLSALSGMDSGLTSLGVGFLGGAGDTVRNDTAGSDPLSEAS